MSPRKSGRRRLFGKARKVVKIEGQKFTAVYTMSKVLVHEPPLRKSAPDASSPHDAAIRDAKARVHGPFQSTFDYAPFMPKKRNGRWYPGKWLPLVAKTSQKMCYIGYHGCTTNKVDSWSGRSGTERERVWLIEGVGPLEQDPKSQKPMTTQITYHMTKRRYRRGKWVNGIYVGGRWVEPKKVRNQIKDRAHNEKVLEARENGSFAYDVSADKYNFQSIRILRPLTDAPKRVKKPRKKADTSWRTIKSKSVLVYTKTGRRVPGYGWSKAS